MIACLLWTTDSMLMMWSNATNLRAVIAVIIAAIQRGLNLRH